MKSQPMSAGMLLSALETKHVGDFFVSECKDGPTTTRNHRQLDGWALLPTWSPVTMYGYEIKVSRSDFLRDTKADSYLSLCHLLYFVAPKGLIHPDELPEGVGLMEALRAATGAAKLITRRKARRREIEMPVNLLLYVLMYRAESCVSRYGTKAIDVREQWRRACQERSELGRLVKQAIRVRWSELEERARQAEENMRRYEGVRRTLAALGFDADRPPTEWNMEKQLREAVDAVPPQLLAQLNYAISTLTETRRQLTALVEKRDALAGHPVGA